MTSGNLAGLGMALQEPQLLSEPQSHETQEGTHQYLLTDVDDSDPVFKEISIDFENAGLQVTKVERLKNTFLLKRYLTERTTVLEHRKGLEPNFKLNEKFLYHGTGIPKLSICEEGLDSRMAKQGCFGKGIYFSDYPKKCVKYAERGKTDNHFILLMRVIRGDAKVYDKGKKDKKLVREPEKVAPYNGYRFYDSVEGCPVNHKEFVVYESRRALVECIITYTRIEQDSVPRIIHLTVERGPNSESVEDADDAAAAAADGQESDDDSENSFDSDSSGSDSEDEGDGPDNVGDDNQSTSGEDDNNDDIETDATADVGQIIQETQNATYKTILKQKRKEFKAKMGKVDDYKVDHCLLQANMEVDAAIKIFQDMPKEVELSNKEIAEADAKLEEEIKRAELTNSKAPPITPESDQWNNLSETDKEEVIKGLIDDFLAVTGMEEKDMEYARTCLNKQNLNLDKAIMSHYEEMARRARMAQGL